SAVVVAQDDEFDCGELPLECHASITGRTRSISGPTASSKLSTVSRNFARLCSFAAFCPPFMPLPMPPIGIPPIVVPSVGPAEAGMVGTWLRWRLLGTLARGNNLASAG